MARAERGDDSRKIPEKVHTSVRHRIDAISSLRASSVMPPRKKIPRIIPDSPTVLDYPSTMSMYERESRAAEAQLKARREKNSSKSRKRNQL